MPGCCGKAEVIDWAPTFADLFWTPPTHDGGTPILTYIIQMKGIAHTGLIHTDERYDPYLHTSYR